MFPTFQSLDRPLTQASSVRRKKTEEREERDERLGKRAQKQQQERDLWRNRSEESVYGKTKGSALFRSFSHSTVQSAPDREQSHRLQSAGLTSSVGQRDLWNSFYVEPVSSFRSKNAVSQVSERNAIIQGKEGGSERRRAKRLTHPHPHTQHTMVGKKCSSRKLF